MLLGTYEKACKPWSPRQRRRGISARTAGARPRAHRAVAGDRLQAFPRHREGRHQADHQRPLHLRAGRQPAGRPGAGPDQLLGAPAASWPASARAAASAWRCPTGWSHGDPGFDVWGMDVARFGEWATPALHQRQGARELFAPLLASASPTRNCRPRARRRRRRSTTRCWRNNAVMGDMLGPGDAALVRAEGHGAEGRRLLPPLQRFRPDRRGSARGARARRRHRDRQLRQI